MKRVLLINQGKTENLGDKAIYQTFKELLISNDCNVDFAGFAQTNEQSMMTMSTDRNDKLRYYVKKFIPNSLIWLLKYKKRISEEFASLKSTDYDLVIIGGGQLIKTKGVFIYTLYSWQKILEKNLKCPVILVGVGADSNYSLIEKLIYNKILPKFDRIYVRDEKSKEVLKDNFKIKAKFIPDIVFSYSNFFPIQKKEKTNLLVMIFDYKTMKKHFGTEYTLNEYYDEWINLIKKNSKLNTTITLGYTTIEDKIETLRFANHLSTTMPKETRVEILNTDSLDNLIEILEVTKTIISGRMHGMLLGMNYGCEIIPFVVSPKIETFKNEWIDNKLNLKEIYLETDLKMKEIIKIYSL